jgi:hypothetical protein
MTLIRVRAMVKSTAILTKAFLIEEVGCYGERADAHVDHDHGGGGAYEGKEVPVVLATYAVVQPLAVVVKLVHTSLAC